MEFNIASLYQASNLTKWRRYKPETRGTACLVQRDQAGIGSGE